MVRVKSIIVFILTSLVFLLATPFALLLNIFSLGKLNSWIVTNFGRFLGLFTLTLLNIKTHVSGWDNIPKEPVIFIINHSSTLDIPAILSLGLPNTRFVAKKEFRFNLAISLIAHATGQIFIDRGNSEKAIATLTKAYDKLRKDDLNLLVAPEGSRIHETAVGEFKKGAFKIAQDLNRPVIPIVIKGLVKLAPGKKIEFNAGDVNLDIKKPILIKDDIPLIEQIKPIREQYIKWLS